MEATESGTLERRQVDRAPVEVLARSVTTLVAAAERGIRGAYDVPRVNVLTHVAAVGVTRPRDIARELRLAPSSVTRHLQALHEAGHVDMVSDPADRRSALVSATDAGRAELHLLQRTGVEVFAHVVADWSPEDVTNLATLLDRLRADWAARGPAARARHTRTAERTPRWRTP